MDTTDLFHAAATLSSKTSLKKKSSGPLQMKPKAVMVDTGQISVSTYKWSTYKQISCSSLSILFFNFQQICEPGQDGLAGDSG